MEFCQLAVPAPLCLQKTELHAWGWERGGDGRKSPLRHRFQWLEQIKGHSCFTFNWKQPNCKINPGSTCVHDDSIVAGSQNQFWPSAMCQALTCCTPSFWPEEQAAVLSFIRLLSPRMGSVLPSFRIRQSRMNWRTQHKILYLLVWEFEHLL